MPTLATDARSARRYRPTSKGDDPTMRDLLGVTVRNRIIQRGGVRERPLITLEWRAR